MTIRPSPDRFTLLLFFDPTRLTHKNAIRYADVIYQKHRLNGLEVYGLFANIDAHSPSAFSTVGKISFPLIIDTNNTIHDYFDIDHCCGGIVLYDRSQHMVFRDSSLLQDEDLRKLIERQLFRRIMDFGYYDSSSFINKHTLDDLLLIDIKTYRSIRNHDMGEYMLITFFPKACYTCGIQNRLQMLAEIQAMFPTRFPPEKIGLVFPETIEEIDIGLAAGSFMDRFSTYLCRDFFPLEYKYITDKTRKADPITVFYNRYSGILIVESYDSTQDTLKADLVKAIGDLQ